MLIYAGSWREADSSQPRPHFRLKRICLNTANLQSPADKSVTITACATTHKSLAAWDFCHVLPVFTLTQHSCALLMLPFFLWKQISASIKADKKNMKVTHPPWTFVFARLKKARWGNFLNVNSIWLVRFSESSFVLWEFAEHVQAGVFSTFVSSGINIQRWFFYSLHSYPKYLTVLSIFATFLPQSRLYIANKAATSVRRSGCQRGGVVQPWSPSSLELFSWSWALSVRNSGDWSSKSVGDNAPCSSISSCIPPPTAAHSQRGGGGCKTLRKFQISALQTGIVMESSLRWKSLSVLVCHDSFSPVLQSRGLTSFRQLWHLQLDRCPPPPYRSTWVETACGEVWPLLLLSHSL